MLAANLIYDADTWEFKSSIRLISSTQMISNFFVFSNFYWDLWLSIKISTLYDKDGSAFGELPISVVDFKWEDAWFAWFGHRNWHLNWLGFDFLCFAWLCFALLVKSNSPTLNG